MGMNDETTMPAIQELPLADIGLDTRPERQVRTLDPAWVRHLAEETDPAEWDPIQVRPWPATDPYPPGEEGRPWQVISGYHRTTAARSLRLPTIRGVIVDAPDDASFTLLALKGNLRHGKAMSSEEQKAAVVRLHALGMSLREIASETRIPKSTVHNWLTNRDTNAGRMSRTGQQPDRDALPAGGWVGMPTVDLDAQRRVEIDRAIAKVVALDPSSSMTPGEVLGWVAGLAPSARRALADQVRASATFWAHLSAALVAEGDAAGGQAVRVPLGKAAD